MGWSWGSGRTSSVLTSQTSRGNRLNKLDERSSSTRNGSCKPAAKPAQNLS